MFRIPSRSRSAALVPCASIRSRKLTLITVPALQQKRSEQQKCSWRKTLGKVIRVHRRIGECRRRLGYARPSSPGGYRSGVSAGDILCGKGGIRRGGGSGARRAKAGCQIPPWQKVPESLGSAGKLHGLAGGLGGGGDRRAVPVPADEKVRSGGNSGADAAGADL